MANSTAAENDTIPAIVKAFRKRSGITFAAAAIRMGELLGWDEYPYERFKRLFRLEPSPKTYATEEVVALIKVYQKTR